jgi:hypothetical protein
MFELNITPGHLRVFKQIIDAYYLTTKFPAKDRWKKMSPNEIWFWMINQIMVVGSSESSKKFWADETLKTSVDYFEISKIKKDSNTKQRINNVLRMTGTRYAAENIDKCQKTQAIFHNLKFLQQFKDGPKGMMNNLHQLKAKNKELARVYALNENLKFFKNKSARDFLMNMGMNWKTIAIDIRTQNIFDFLKIKFPSTAEISKIEIYERTEIQITNKICQPLNILPLHFDRILYQNYFKIIKSDFLQLKINFY